LAVVNVGSLLPSFGFKAQASLPRPGTEVPVLQLKFPNKSPRATISAEARELSRISAKGDLHAN